MTVVPDPFQVRVAQVALSIAQRYGFALGGGHALLAHGLVHRPTEDVDLFTDLEGGVRTATGRVRSALAEAGLQVDAQPEPSELADVIYGMDDAFEEIAVSDGSATASLSLARLARQRAPIEMAVGPVLHLDDVIGSKVCALGTRAMVRDYIDVAASLRRGYDRARLIELAHEHDPSLAEDDLAFAMRRLDAMPDAAFAPYHLTDVAVAELRDCFAEWPR